MILSLPKLQRFCLISQPFWLGLSVLLFVMGIYYSLFASPADEVQGEYMRVMYVHVPAAWLSLSLYTSLSVMNALGFTKGGHVYHYIARQIAPIGFGFAIITLITGMIWGQPTWGTWWAWDARLTSMLVLAIFYVGYIRWVDIEDPSTFKSGALLSVVGWLTIPVIKGSVEWWHTLHQPASIRIFKASNAIDPSMRVPLLIMTLAYLSFTFFIFTVRFPRFLNFQKEFINAMRFYDE